MQGGPKCPFLEKATSCPDDVDDLPPCEDPCLKDDDYCEGMGPTKELCGASDAEPQCGGKAVYRVTSDPAHKSNRRGEYSLVDLRTGRTGTCPPRAVG